MVHDVPDLEGATAVCDGMWLGGWRAAQPKVSDRTLAEGRFKFFLGCTEWKAGQLQQEVRATRPPTPPPARTPDLVPPRLTARLTRRRWTRARGS